MTERAYAVNQAAGRVQVREYEPTPPGPLEVDIAVTHCGVCSTDVGMIDDHYGISRFPVVAGHEAVGVVRALGDAVPPSLLALGQRVGIGARAGSCFTCEWCLSGRQHLCPHSDETVFRGDGGGFATRLRAGDWRHVYPILDVIASEQAGPLLCAGATVFAAIVRHGIRATDRVAVVGVGGLGHLAVQFLAAWGCHVTAVSRTAAKADDSRVFGAHAFIDSDTGLEGAAASFDFILATASGDLPWDAYFKTLRPQGTLCTVGVPDGSFTVHPLSLLIGEKKLAAGVTGPISETRQMLDFAARHDIRPVIEKFPVARIDEALDHVRQGRAHYRAVLEM